MTVNFRLHIALALALLATATSASGWVGDIKKVVPASIVLTEAEETAGFVNLKGTAKSNDAISALMRAIDQADLGSPQLQAIKRTDGVSEFVLRVKAPR